jgi:ATP phosphoribosyltransferase
MRPKEIKLALPKGRMFDGVSRLLDGSGVAVRVGPRDYRPEISLDGWGAKLLKPQCIVTMLDNGSRDLGFTGRDWVEELEADLVELVDTGLDPVRLVAAMPEALVRDGGLRRSGLVVASEYRRLTNEWIERRELEDARFVQSYGATEVYPPEDADCIVDNSATGSTLRANGLEVVDEVLRSSTRLYASRAAMDDPDRRDAIESFALLVRSVVDARERVMLEVNVSPERLDQIVDRMPCMREPTVSPLFGDDGYAVKAAVPRRELPRLIPELRNAGGTDVVVTRLDQIVP